MRLSKFLFGLAVVFGTAAGVTAGCVTVNYPDTAFRCDPSQNDPCPEDFLCCSDDPMASLDSGIALGVLPDYPNMNGGDGTPVFSGVNNGRSRSGMCVRAGVVPPEAGVDIGGGNTCPVPCNPTWSNGDIEEVCGNNTICCQTTEIEPNDCVLDADQNCWRAVTGEDIGGLTNWNAAAHDTHQDPNGTGCIAFAQGNGTDQAECFKALSVANQRGFCLATSANVVACPLEADGYVDVCEQRNQLEGKSCN